MISQEPGRGLLGGTPAQGSWTLVSWGLLRPREQGRRVGGMYEDRGTRGQTGP